MFQRLCFLLPTLLSIVLAEQLLAVPPERRFTADLLPADSQYHIQDSQGIYNYGYSNGESSKQESRSLDGVTKGSYSYMDSNGVLQSVVYEADAKNGFRVSGTNIPVAPTTPDHPSEITPAFTSLLKAPITGGDENQRNGNAHNAREMAKISEETKTKDTKNEQDKNIIIKNSEEKFDALSTPPGNGFREIYVYPVSQINPHFPPYQFNPSAYTFNPAEVPQRYDYKGYNHLGLFPALQQNSYPFLGRNVPSSYPMYNGLIPLFGMENSGFGNNPGFSYSSQGDINHYGGYSNVGSGRMGMNEGDGMSRSYPFFGRNVRF